MTKTSPYNLLKDVVNDNPTIKFPIELIHPELIQTFLNPEEFDYFTTICYQKLKREYGQVYGHAFLSLLELRMKLSRRSVYDLDKEVFQVEFDNFLYSLENLYITRINKDSPDGEMMSEMI